MLLSHFASHADKVFTSEYSTPEDNVHKPGGLWLSDESGYGWLSFLRDRVSQGNSEWADAYEVWKYKYDFIVEPSQLHRVLCLQTPADIKAFTSYYQESSDRECGGAYATHIEWTRVKAEYKGILITPFQPKYSRIDPRFHWYRFDCASGCFWDISCLRQIKIPNTTVASCLRATEYCGTSGWNTGSQE